MNKKFLIFLPLIVSFGLLIFYFQSKRAPEQTNLSVTPTPEVQTPTEPPVMSDEELIKTALIAKHGWNPEEIKITISKNDGQYATGGAGSVTPGPGGGIWFATKVNGNWEIVWDGNGMASCEELSKYPDYPADLIPQCYIKDTGELIKR